MSSIIDRIYGISQIVRQNEERILDVHQQVEKRAKAVDEIFHNLRWSRNDVFASLKNWLVNRAIKRFVVEKKKNSMSQVIKKVLESYDQGNSEEQVYKNLRIGASGDFSIYNDLELLLLSYKPLSSNLSNEKAWKSLKQFQANYTEKKLQYLINLLQNPPAKISKKDKSTLLEVHFLYKMHKKITSRRSLPKSFENLFKACDKTNLTLFAFERRMDEAYKKNPLDLEEHARDLKKATKEKIESRNAQENQKVTLFDSLRKDLVSNRMFRFIKHDAPKPNWSDEKSWHYDENYLIENLSKDPFLTHEGKIQQILLQYATTPIAIQYGMSVPFGALGHSRTYAEVSFGNVLDNINIEYTIVTDIKETASMKAKVIGSQTLKVTFEIFNGRIGISDPKITDTTFYLSSDIPFQSI